jgi:hypothetical protein
MRVEKTEALSGAKFPERGTGLVISAENRPMLAYEGLVGAAAGAAAGVAAGAGLALASLGVER